jgi:beta-glucuronidase
MNHSRIAGLFIWQFCDVRVTEEVWGVIRPRCMNNKGVVDENRNPKDVCNVVRRNFKSFSGTLDA